MSELDDKISTIQSLLRTLTWGKLLLLTTFLSVVGFSYAVFENRNSVYEFFGSPRNIPPVTVLKLKKSSKDEIHSILVKSDLIIAVQVTLVDFQRNTRLVVYTDIDEPELKSIYSKFTEKAPIELPLFNADTTNNQRLVSLVNGEFKCILFKDSLMARVVPATMPYISTLCLGPIPPYYGRFSGIVGIYLSREPTTIEFDQIRNLSKELGLTIYNNDFR